ncbi:Flp/Fap pilin component [Phycisphaerae bacterium RAS1]|nr:Flp/Fap pilin component [Phycisphaerae bacterium RAS1]
MNACNVYHTLVRFLRDEDGPTATEYAILLAMLVLVAVAAIQGIGSRMMNIYQNIDGSLPEGF